MAARERRARVPVGVVAVAVKREFGVRKFDIAPVYPGVVVVRRPAWMSVANVSKAFPHAWHRQRLQGGCARHGSGARPGGSLPCEHEHEQMLSVAAQGGSATLLNASAVRVVSPCVRVMPDGDKRGV